MHAQRGRGRVGLPASPGGMHARHVRHTALRRGSTFLGDAKRHTSTGRARRSCTSALVQCQHHVNIGSGPKGRRARRGNSLCAGLVRCLPPPSHPCAPGRRRPHRLLPLRAYSPAPRPPALPSPTPPHKHARPPSHLAQGCLEVPCLARQRLPLRPQRGYGGGSLGQPRLGRVAARRGRAQRCLQARLLVLRLASAVQHRTNSTGAPGGQQVQASGTGTGGSRTGGGRGWGWVAEPRWWGGWDGPRPRAGAAARPATATRRAAGGVA